MFKVSFFTFFNLFLGRVWQVKGAGGMKVIYRHRNSQGFESRSPDAKIGHEWGRTVVMFWILFAIAHYGVKYDYPAASDRNTGRYHGTSERTP